MTQSTLPLFPTDDGWPYPDADGAGALGVTEEPDLDELELRADPLAFSDLTQLERAALFTHFGLDHVGPPVPMKELGANLGCSRSDAREALGSAIDKMRRRLSS